MRARLAVAIGIVAAAAWGTGCSKPAPKTSTVTFGAAVSLTGKTAKEGEYVKDGYQMFVDDVNRQGGLLVGGKRVPVALKTYDDESNPDTSAKLVEKLVSEDKVDLLLGPYGTGPVFSASAIAEKYDVPMVEPGGAGMKIFTRGFKNIWGTLPAAPDYLKSAIDLIASRDPKAKKAALLIENDSFSQEVADGAAAYLREKGFTVVYSQQYPKDTRDVSSLLTAAKAAAPDIVLGASHLADAELIVKQAREIGLNAKAWVFSVGPATPEFGKALGKDAAYVMGVTPWTPAMKFEGKDLYGTPRKFADAYQKRYGYEPPYHAASAVATMLAFQHAVEAAGSTAPAAVREKLRKMDVPTFYGQLRFKPEGIIVKPMGVVQWTADGTMKTVWPAEVAEQQALYPAPTWDRR